MSLAGRKRGEEEGTRASGTRRRGRPPSRAGPGGPSRSTGAAQLAPPRNFASIEFSPSQRREIKFFFFFRRDALKEQFGKEPNRVSCLAVKSALLGTRHPRKEKEAALQTVTGKPACLDGKILICKVGQTLQKIIVR